MTTRKHGLGYRPDLGDPRDFLYKPQFAAAARPRSVDLRPKMPPVWDQGQLGSAARLSRLPAPLRSCTASSGPSYGSITKSG
jgi:hypothetical protein